LVHHMSPCYERGMAGDKSRVGLEGDNLRVKSGYGPPRVTGLKVLEEERQN